MRDFGRVVDVSDSGTAVVRSDLGVELKGFAFDKIESYRGQSPSEIGLRPGRAVEWWLKDDRIVRVKLQAETGWRRIADRLLGRRAS